MTWCPLGLEAELIRREKIENVVRVNARNHRPHGFSGELCPLFLQLGPATVGIFLCKRLF